MRIIVGGNDTLGAGVTLYRVALVIIKIMLIILGLYRRKSEDRKLLLMPPNVTLILVHRLKPFMAHRTAYTIFRLD
jgi:sulfite exporter TauE/SafE